ncbi:PH domain-containing protein [Promicromonospora sp. NPDC057488]|uniref:PH domain-containing protein n=1 Tax=Promicromonospora sp. NPDC057488 TaxID=3346147 RepID=UPI0036711B6F
MTNSGYRRTYRIRALGKVLAALTVPAVGAVALVWDIASDDKAPSWVALLVGLFFVLFFGLVIRVIVSTATVADEDHLTVRGVFRSRSVPWREVQAVELEPNPAAAAVKNQPTVQAVMYDATSKRIVLPYLNDRGTADVEWAVADLQEAWRARRGQVWEPSGVVTAEVKRRRKPPLPAAAWGRRARPRVRSPRPAGAPQRHHR